MTVLSSKKTADLPLLLLDRDGTLIEEGEYMSDPRQVKLLPGVIPALKQLRRAGFHYVVVSNQSGVGRGLMTRRQMETVRDYFIGLLRRKGVRLDGYYVCPHKPSDRCACRKPKQLLVKRAAKDLKRSSRGSISIGDRPSDVELGQRTGGLGLLVKTGYGRKFHGKAGADAEFRDFAAAARWILKQHKKGFSKHA